MNRACKIASTRTIGRMDGEYGEKAAKKFDKALIKRRRRSLEKREAMRIIND